MNIELAQSKQGEIHDAASSLLTNKGIPGLLCQYDVRSLDDFYEWVENYDTDALFRRGKSSSTPSGEN